MTKSLQGVTVAVLAADGFEQVEVTHPIRRLKREGATVRVISLRPGRIRGMNLLWRGRKLPVDQTVADADPRQYGALLLPGGFINPDFLRQSEHVREFVRAMDRLGRPIAVLCHGPEVLISANVIRGRRLTSWPGIADDVRNAGGIWEDSVVVRDGNWVSSRGPRDLLAFERAMLDLFAELAPRELVVPERPVRWATHLSRAGTVAAGLAIGLGARQVLAARRRNAFRPARQFTREMLHDLSLAVALGAVVFAKAALEPANRALPQHEGQGSAPKLTAPWQAFALTSGASLGIAALTWVTGDRPRTVKYAPRLTHAKDTLLAASVVTGAINAAAGLMLARADRASMQSDAQASPATNRLATVRRTGLVSGYAHTFALTGTIALSAILARGARSPR